MGYEITFYFRKEISKGEYSEEVEKKTVKIGEPYDDIGLEVLAGKIISQLARRNILIDDIDVYEFTKKKLAFRFSDDGIVISNHKFKFDDGSKVTILPTSTENSEQAQPTTDIQQLLSLLATNPGLLNQLTNNPKKAAHDSNVSIPGSKTEKVIRYEIFDPVDQMWANETKKRGLAFTMGKRYPILKERPANPEYVEFGMLYTTIDDKGNRQVLTDKLFTPDVGNLENGFVEPFKPTTTRGMTVQDSNGDYSVESVPVLRR